MVRTSAKAMFLNKAMDAVLQIRLVHPAVDRMERERALVDDRPPRDRNAQLLRAILTMHARRRVLPPRIKPPADLLSRLEIYAEAHDDMFRTYVRMPPAAFDHIVSLMSTCKVYQPCRTGRPQRPVRAQVMVGLIQLGRYGNAASPKLLAADTNLAVGSVVLYTNRLIQAAHELEPDVLRWPTRAERLAAKAHMFRKSSGMKSWAQGWSMVDGTNVPLAMAPSWHEKDYCDRKANHSLNVQVVNLPNTLQIIDFVVGARGSCQDSRAWAKSAIVQDPWSFLDKGNSEFIWTDLGYGFSRFTCSPYLHSASAHFKDMRIFNYRVSQIRVRSEHAIGYLKGRMQSLRGLQIQITREARHLHARAWIKACMVLHNLAIPFDRHGRDWKRYAQELKDDEWHKLSRDDTDGLDDEGKGVLGQVGSTREDAERIRIGKERRERLHQDLVDGLQDGVWVDSRREERLAQRRITPCAAPNAGPQPT